MNIGAATAALFSMNRLSVQFILIMKKTLKLAVVAVLTVSAFLTCIAASAQEKPVRYEGSVSLGSGYFRYSHFGATLHTSHGVRFNREGLRFLYLGVSLEQHMYLAVRPYTPMFTFVQIHAKTYFPAGSKVQATAGLEFGAARLAQGIVEYSPNLTPSVGVEFLTKGKQAVMLTVRTYINKDSVTGEQPNPGLSVMVGYRF